MCDDVCNASILPFRLNNLQMHDGYANRGAHGWFEKKYLKFQQCVTWFLITRPWSRRSIVAGHFDGLQDKTPVRESVSRVPQYSFSI